jgi:hypothetical protein
VGVDLLLVEDVVDAGAEEVASMKSTVSRMRRNGTSTLL